MQFVSSFMSRFAQVKARDLSQSITEAIVKFDPQTASEVQIGQFADELSTLSGHVAQLRVESRREQKEADDAQANYDKLLGAAGKLEADLRDASKADKHAAIETSLSSLMLRLETLRPQLAREKKEAADAKALLEEFEKAASDAAIKVTTAKARLKEAVQEMDSASRAKKKAEDGGEHAEVLAGIRRSSNSLGTALSAMENIAQKDRVAADAENIKADLLLKNAPTAVESDPLVLAAMGEDAAGAPQPTLSERLAALRAA